MEITCTACTSWLAALAEIFSSEAFRGATIFFGVVIALTSVLSAKSTARKKQTADLLFGSRADKELGEGYKCLQKLHNDSGSNIRSLAKKSRKNSVEANQIRYILNHWERIAVGLRQGIYDEKMLREANWNTVTRMYFQAQAYIDAVREIEKKDTYYQCLEALAKRWESKPLPSFRKRKGFWPWQ